MSRLIYCNSHAVCISGVACSGPVTFHLLYRPIDKRRNNGAANSAPAPEPEPEPFIIEVNAGGLCHS